VPPEAVVTNRAGGGIRITTIRSAAFPVSMDWTLATSAFPGDASVLAVETLICGRGEGDFYEVYGPYGADPVEYEVTPPSADGCWHFTGDDSDYAITLYVSGDASLVIDRIEFVVTFDQ